MALKTIVKVGCITNLSDARYCAGMGVDYLGFRVCKDDPHHVPAEKFQEFRGWFAGPKVVAELQGIKTVEEVNNVIEHYAPDILEVSPKELPFVAGIDKQVILNIGKEKFQNTGTTSDLKENIAFILLENPGDRNLEEIDFRILVTPDAGAISVQDIIARGQADGLALTGSFEERPGLKSYEGLADILEELEVDD